MTRFGKIVVATTAVALVLAGCGSTEPTGAKISTPSAPASVPTVPASTPTRSVDPPSPSSTPSSTPSWSPGLTGSVRDDRLLGANPVHLEPGYGIASVTCRLPAWRLQPAAAQAFYQAAIRCHDQAWRGTLTHFGLTLKSPRLWAGAKGSQYNGACGSNQTGREAFYCPTDETIVMPFDSMRSIAKYGSGYALAVVSHEYGHHIQEQVGVMAAFQARGQAVGYSSQAGQLLSRQLELQAWCFSGMFYGTSTGRGSITKSLSNQAYDNNSHAGDRRGELRLHGTNQNAANWFGWGRHPSLNSAARVHPAIYECNPWAARDAGWLQ